MIVGTGVPLAASAASSRASSMESVNLFDRSAIQLRPMQPVIQNLNMPPDLPSFGTPLHRTNTASSLASSTEMPVLTPMRRNVSLVNSSSSSSLGSMENVVRHCHNVTNIEQQLPVNIEIPQRPTAPFMGTIRNIQHAARGRFSPFGRARVAPHEPEYAIEKMMRFTSASCNTTTIKHINKIGWKRFTCYQAKTTSNTKDMQPLLPPDDDSSESLL